MYHSVYQILTINLRIIITVFWSPSTAMVINVMCHVISAHVTLISLGGGVLVMLIISTQ